MCYNVLQAVFPGTELAQHDVYIGSAHHFSLLNI